MNVTLNSGSEQLFSNITVVATTNKIKYKFATQSQSFMFRFMKQRVNHKVKRILEAVTERILHEFALDLGTVLEFVVNNFLM